MSTVNGVGSSSQKKVLVSFMKCRKIAAIIQDIQMYQNQPYSLQVEPSIRVRCFFALRLPAGG